MAWTHFLAAISRCAPQVLRSLAKIALTTETRPAVSSREIEQRLFSSWGGKLRLQHATTAAAVAVHRAGKPLDETTEVALAHWAKDHGLPWTRDWEHGGRVPVVVRVDDGAATFLIHERIGARDKTKPLPPKNVPLARWWMQEVRAHVAFWRRNPTEAGRWFALTNPPHGAERGYATVWNPDTQDFEAVWPSVEMQIGLDALKRVTRTRIPLEWHPIDELEASFRKRAQKRINEYIEQMKRMPGTVKTPAYSRRDFNAFVREHVNDEPLSQIARTEFGRTDSSALRKRNQGIAKLLGLTLRQRRRGRRPTDKRRRASNV